MIASNDLFTINKYGNDLDEDIFCFGLFRMGKLDIMIFMKCALMYLKFSQLILLDKMKC